MRYAVEIREIHVVTVEVDADSEDEAREKASVVLEESDSLDMEYSHTLDWEDWPVRKIRNC